MINNPVGRAAAIVFGFWWAVLTLAGLWYWNPDEIPVSQMTAIVVGSLIVPLVAAVGGFAGALAFRSGRNVVRKEGLMQGDAAAGARIQIGSIPRAPEPPRGKVTETDLAKIPNWTRFKAAFPAHAAAVRAVMEVMAAKRDLPASPVPGGHGGRTLIQHSVGVVEWMIKLAPKWVYEGQKNKKGQVVRAPINGPHKFTPDDFGLLVLTAFAHDIGKTQCYALQPDGRVLEVLPDHDTEGGKLLRLLPEVMALSLEDRRSLITTVAHYHKPFMIPDAGWVTDRTRSLMELLIKADHATGRSEGHTLTNYPQDDDEGVSLKTFADSYKDPGARIEAVIQSAEAGAMGKTLLDVADAVDEATAEAEASMGDEAIALAAAKAHERMDEEAELETSREVAIFAEALKSARIHINSKQANLRLGFKLGEWLYISEQRIRGTVANLPATRLQAAGLFAAQLMDGPSEGSRLNAFTEKLLEALAEKGCLKTSAVFDGVEGRVSAKNAQWKIATKINKAQLSTPVGGGFIIVRADTFGMAQIKDWHSPITIEKPFYGMNQLTGKAGATRAAEPTVPFDEDPEDRRARQDAASAAAASDHDDAESQAGAQMGFGDDLLASLHAGEAPTMNKAQLGGVVLEDIWQAIRGAELEPAKEKEGRAYFKLDGSAGAIITQKIAEAGIDAADAGITQIMGASGDTFYSLPMAEAPGE